MDDTDEDEPNLCSIEMAAWHISPHELALSYIIISGSIIIDQSLDITLRGELNAAMAAVRFLFPETVDGDVTTYSLNREFIQKMNQSTDPDGGFRSCGEQDGIKITFKANKTSVDVGHLINAIRMTGGASGVESKLRERYGTKQ